MSDGRHHRFGRGKEVIHRVGWVSEHQLIVLLRDNILLPSNYSWVVLEELQQMVDG